MEKSKRMIQLNKRKLYVFSINIFVTLFFQFTLFFVPIMITHDIYSVALLQLRLIPQGMVVNNLGPNHLSCPKALDSDQPFDCTTFVFKVLTAHGIKFRLSETNAFPHTHTIDVGHLTQHQQVQLLTSLAIQRYGTSIEPINERI